MRARTKLALGGGIATTATALGIAVGGVIGAGTLVVVGPLATPAQADGLQPFDDCDELHDWYVSRGLRDVGPYGWDMGVIAYATDGGAMRGDLVESTVPMADGAAPEVAGSTDSGSAASAKSNSPTGTNTQEVDVDEPDITKTDGRIVVRLENARTLVVSDVTGAQPRELGRLPLKEVYGAELLLVGDHVLVLTGDAGGPMPIEGDIAMPDSIGRYVMPSTGSRLFDVDISDPTDPRIASTQTYTGRLISARVYDDVVRLVTSTPRPQLKWTYPDRGVSDREATRRNRALVRSTTLADWLPSVTSDGRKSELVECDQVLHPKQWAGQETLAVTTFPADDVEQRESVAITADGQVVYSSTDRLYVASNRMPGPGIWRSMGDRIGAPEIEPLPVTTDLHAFALDGPETTYVASGSVRGTLRDRWSMDEHDGTLRVAWTREGKRVHNGITTLAERDGELVEVGELGDLGIDENIQSVRWFDDLAVLVTFRQIDPLYTIDLSDPARPRELGALKITGYSGYLHPIGDDLLLGLGVDADAQGRNLGAQAAVFDIADPTNTRRTDRVGFGSETEMPAIYDPRTFTWLPGSRTGLTTVDDWRGGRAKLVALKIAPNGTLSDREIGTADQGGQTRVLPLADGRVAVVDQELRVLEVG